MTPSLALGNIQEQLEEKEHQLEQQSSVTETDAEQAPSSPSPTQAIRIYDNVNVSRTVKRVCCGIIAHKDLMDKKVQGGLRLCHMYWSFHTSLKCEKVRQVKGTSNTFSLFCVECEDESESVRYVIIIMHFIRIFY